MKDFDLRGYLSNNRLLESKDEAQGGVTPFYLIGDKEVSKDEVLAYKYSNPEKPVKDNGWPKWMYSNNDSEGKTLKWSTIKSDMENLEKEYGKGNVVVGGSTNAGGPYIETYVESQNQTSTVTEAKMGREKIEGVLWDLEQVIRKIAHISGKSTQEAAQLAVDHMQEVFDEDNLDEAGTLKA